MSKNKRISREIEKKKDWGEIIIKIIVLNKYIIEPSFLIRRDYP
jgi:hypothetical protein